MLVPLLIAAVVGYLLGSLPFGYLVARAKGVNIFEVGSKNPGATNVRRVLGHGAGNLVLFLDLLKGALAVGWVVFIAQSSVRAFGTPGAHNGWYAMIGGVETGGARYVLNERGRGGGVLVGGHVL